MSTAVATFQFDEATHTYSENGVVIQSVTQILSSMGYSNMEAAERFNPEALERKRQLGKLVHQLAHFYDEGDLDEGPYQGFPVLMNRLAAYKKFRAETGYTPIVNEGRHLFDVFGMKYGGQFDSIGSCADRSTPNWIVDIKNASGSPQRSWGLQLAAYELGIKHAKPAFIPAPSGGMVRVIVQLFDDASYRLFTSADRNSKIFSAADMHIFQAALAVSIDKSNHGLNGRNI